MRQGVVCGFLVKAAVFPFHFWLADAHGVAPTPVSVVFARLAARLVDLRRGGPPAVTWLVVGLAALGIASELAMRG